ncbi:MAG TPA: hypothetical protein VMF56_05455 [Acidobacteriaceae bacterium]|nr:hypothetical protein [Acidobacteriaceae bacterium]
MLRSSFRLSGLRSFLLLSLAMSASLAISGCRNSGNTFDMSRHATQWAAAKTSARQELTEIPPPLKDVYLNINQEPQWQNPFLSVEQNMIQLRIYLPDENSSPIDRGGITRLSSARKQVVNVRLAELPRALSSLPNGAWPYGRVVAIGREKDTPQNHAWFPNHLDITVRALQDMGVVVDDWNHPATLP